MRLSRGPFLGQVPLRRPGIRFLGQTGQTVSVQRWTDENGTVHEITYTSGAGTMMPHPFTPGETPEEYERIEAANPEIAKQQSQCAALQEAYLNAQARWRDVSHEEGPAEESAFQAYQSAEDALNKCHAQIDALINYKDFGGTMPWNPEPTTYEWPKEVPTPESYEHPPAPTPPPPAPVATTDWRFEGCPPGYQRIVRGGACVPPGLLSAGLNTPGTTMTPMTTTPAVLQGRLPVTPLYRGRF